MKRLELKPDGWPCRLSECPPGHFLYHDIAMFRSEYSTGGKPDAYNGGGEFFCPTDCNAAEAIVQPLIAEWVEYDE